MFKRLVSQCSAKLSFNTLLFLGFAVMLGVAYLTKIRYMDLYSAWIGFTPIAYVYQKMLPEQFALNFFSGIENFDRSLIMWIYPLAYKFLGIPPEWLLNVMIGLEYVAVSLVIWGLCRTLLPKASPWVLFLALGWALTSWARNMNFAEFAQPFFVGQYYNFADFFRVFGILFALQQRWSLSATFLAVGCMVHPILGMMATVFAGATLLPDWRRILTPPIRNAILLFLGLTGGWILLMYQQAGFDGGGIPNALWFDLTRLSGSHWYALEAGKVSSWADLYVIPFISFSLLLAYAFSQRRPLSETDRRVLFGMAGMLLLCLLGFVFSKAHLSPSLIKLSLHRANDLIILLGIPYVVNQLVIAYQNGSLLRKIGAFAILISPFFFRTGFPLFVTIAFTLSFWWKALFTEEKAWTPDKNPSGLLQNGLILIALGIFALLLKTHYTHALLSTATVGTQTYWQWVGAAALLMTLCQTSSLQVRHAVMGLLLFGFTLYGSLLWTHQTKPDKAFRAQANAYLQTQHWARENTPEDALFMVEPTVYYGWRDYSRRSSFGNLMEWVNSSWLYDSRMSVLQEGLDRLGTLSINIDDYLKDKPRIKALGRLINDTKEQFYAKDDAWRLNMAKTHGIQYFVLRKELIQEPSQLPVVYENNIFVVLSTQQDGEV